MEIGPLEFGLSANQLPHRPTEAWVIATHVDTSEDPDDWIVSIEEPPDLTHVLHIADLKRRMIFDHEHKFMIGLPPISKRTNFRRFIPQEVFERYFEAVLNRCGQDPSQTPISVLMPALDEDVTRNRYLQAINAVVPRARILSEPEMVLEYFRLVRAELALDPKKNNIILVVDVGASTANLTIVLTNKGGKVASGERGHRRQGRLQAIQGAASSSAGRWVDEQILALWGEDVSDSMTANGSDRLLMIAERLKIEVSRSGQDAQADDRKLEAGYVRLISEELAKTLLPNLSRLGERLWTQLTMTNYAKEQSQQAMEERGATKTTPLRMIDTVILAGGSSQLLGFKDELSRVLDHDPKWLTVGADFGVAAAVGALAHVLDGKRDTGFVAPTQAGSGQWKLDGGLERDILLAWRPNKNVREKRPVVLEAGDPIVYGGGRRAAVLSWPFKRNDSFDARLLPDVAAKGQRAGLAPTTLRVKAKHPVVDIVVSKDRRAHIESDQLRNPREVWLDLDHGLHAGASHPLHAEGQPRTAPPPGPQPYFPRSPELVVDLGMSKTVLVRSTGGRLDVAALADRPEPEAVAGQAFEADIPAPKRSGSSPQGERERSGDPAVVGQPSPAAGDEPASHCADSGSHPYVFQNADSGPKPAGVSWHPSRRRPAPEIGEELRRVMATWQEAGVDLAGADVILTLLSLAVRPFLLIAGPPGCGKSTLARQVGHLLGKRSSDTFLEVPVQAHWLDDTSLWGEGDACHDGGPHPHGLLSETRLARDSLVLFDEVNLTRPEHYLRRVFHHHDVVWQSKEELRWVAIGTLNIDDTSRPPSPKVVDRCGLVEMDQVPFNAASRASIPPMETLPSLTALPALPAGWQETDLDWMKPCLEALTQVVTKEHLRQDLLPSRRTMADILAVVALHDAMGLGNTGLLSRDELMDRLLASRVMVKLSGAIEQLQPALDAVEKSGDDGIWRRAPRTYRRLKIAEAQAMLGYVSSWQ